MIAINERLARVEGHIAEHHDMHTELGERLGRFEQRVDVLKMTRQFTWMVGLFVTTLVAIGVSTLAR